MKKSRRFSFSNNTVRHFSTKRLKRLASAGYLITWKQKGNRSGSTGFIDNPF